MKTTQKEVEPLKVASFFKKFFSAWDIFPILTIKSENTKTSKYIHTLIGVSIMFFIQLVPFFGIHFLEKVLSLKFLTVNSRNFTFLARNASMVGPLILTLVTKFLNIVYSSEAEKNKCSRGLRNASVLVGSLIRHPLLLYYRELGTEAVLTLPKKYLKAIVVFYAIQTLLVSIGCILIEDYLSHLGTGSDQILIYYQYTDLLVQIFNSPVPGTFTTKSFGFSVFLIVFFTLLNKLTEVKVQTYSPWFKREDSIEYTCAKTISYATLIHQIIKVTFSNFLDLGLNPIWWLLYKKPLVSNDFFECLVFTENYHIFFYLPNLRSKEALHMLGWLFLDYGVIFGLILYNLRFFSEEFGPKVLFEKLKKHKIRVKGALSVNHQYTILKSKLDQVRFRYTLIGCFLESSLALIPVYGTVLKGTYLYYAYCKFNSMFETLVKTKNEDLPSVLRAVKKISKLSLT